MLLLGLATQTCASILVHSELDCGHTSEVEHGSEDLTYFGEIFCVFLLKNKLGYLKNSLDFTFRGWMCAGFPGPTLRICVCHGCLEGPKHEIAITKVREQCIWMR